MLISLRSDVALYAHQYRSGHDRVRGFTFQLKAAHSSWRLGCPICQLPFIPILSIREVIDGGYPWQAYGIYEIVEHGHAIALRHPHRRNSLSEHYYGESLLRPRLSVPELVLFFMAHVALCLSSKPSRACAHVYTLLRAMTRESA